MALTLLLDANISWKLTEVLRATFGECFHVDHSALDVPARDAAIWEYAREHGCIIVTKDADFADLIELQGFPPKVVPVRTGNNSSQALAGALIRSKSAIEDLAAGDYGLLELVGSAGAVSGVP